MQITTQKTFPRWGFIPAAFVCVAAVLFLSLSMFRTISAFSVAAKKFVHDIAFSSAVVLPPLRIQFAGLFLSAVSLALFFGMIVLLLWFLRTRYFSYFFWFFAVFLLSLGYHFSFYPGLPLESISSRYCLAFSYYTCPSSCRIGPSSCDLFGLCTLDRGCHPRSWDFPRNRDFFRLVPY